jgi:hypothetical protein
VRAAKVDENHASVARALRSAGALVQSLATVGGGVPDLLCAFRGVLYLLEVKDGAKVPSRRKLTEREQAWHAAWEGYVAIVDGPEAALVAIGAVRRDTH